MTEAAGAYKIISRASRIRLWPDDSARISAKDAAILLGAGVLAAALVAWAPLPLQVPGHAILKAAAPIILGVAAVPRPLAGTMAGAGAATMSTIVLATGVGQMQAAATTSLLAIGPAIDLAIMGIRRERLSIYWRLAIAGLSANLLAFVVRCSTAYFALDGVRPHRLHGLGAGALASFAICGIGAGLLSSVVFFNNDASPSTAK
ncbi:MAG: hypothetical protein IT424_09380 [Pirellulales bacterium]|nr:hypothetical protein [Pirellulales bacterium]